VNLQLHEDTQNASYSYTSGRGGFGFNHDSLLPAALQPASASEMIYMLDALSRY
jgi:hypothetical protein